MDREEAEQMRQLKAKLNTMEELHKMQLAEKDKRIRELEKQIKEQEYDYQQGFDDGLAEKDQKEYIENIKPLKDKIRELEKENHDLRDLLWYNHGCDSRAMYGDEGEMQCNQCLTDFKRDNANTILANFKRDNANTILTKFRMRTKEGREILEQRKLVNRVLRFVRNFGSRG